MLISFEGVNGVGKTSVIEVVKEKLSKEFPNTPIRVITSKPTGETYEKIKPIFEKKVKLTGKMIYELLDAFVQSQCQILYTDYFLRSNGQQEEILLADRWSHSSIVYTAYELIKEGHYAQGRPLTAENCDLYQLYKHNVLNMKQKVEDFVFTKVDPNFGFEELRFFTVLVERYIFEKYVTHLIHDPRLIQKKGLIYPDLAIYVKSEKSKEQWQSRTLSGEKKAISRYENTQEEYLIELLYDYVYWVDQMNHKENQIMMVYDNNKPLTDETHHHDQVQSIIDKIKNYLKEDK